MRGWIPIFIAVSFLLATPSTLGGERKPIVAVFPIEAKGIELSKGLLDRLTDYLGTSLAEVGGYQVIPSEDLRKRLFQEKKKSYKLKCDKKCQIDLARELAAQKTVSTQILKLGSRCTVAVRLYDLMRAATEGAAKAHGNCNEDGIVASLDKAVDKLTGVEKKSEEEARRKAEAKERERLARIDAERKKGPAGIKWVLSKPAGIEFTKTEVTVAQYRSCFNEGKCSAPLTDSGCNWGVAKRNNHPVNCVDWNQANTFCVWAGGRLPTELEWGAEATDSGRRKYPWGDEEVSCQRAIWGAGMGQTDGCGKNSAWPVCSKPAGNSVSGLCDMSGNVFEWTSSWYDKENKYRLVLGGSWELEGQDVLRAPCRGRARPTLQDGRFGFRCGRAAP